MKLALQHNENYVALRIYNYEGKRKETMKKQDTPKNKNTGSHLVLTIIGWTLCVLL